MERTPTPPAADTGVDWRRPTLREAVTRIEAEFGAARRDPPDLARRPDGAGGDGWRARFDDGATVAGVASGCLGLRAWERLSPDALRAICGQWGLPAEDLGLDADDVGA